MDKLKRIAEEPYRIFFPLGILWGMVGVGHWFFYGIGWMPSYSMLLHSSIQTQAYMMCFVLGFLLTAMPRFASAPPLQVQEFSHFLVLMIFLPILYLQGQWLLARLCFISSILLFARFAISRFKAKKDSSVHPPAEFVWIPIAFLHGLLGTLLIIGTSFAIGTPVIAKIGKLLVEQGFILSLVLGVGSFLGPRLMGSFQPFVQVGQSPKPDLRIRSKKIIAYVVDGVLLFLSFVLEGYDYKFIAFLIRAILISSIYFRTKTLIVRPLVSDQFVWLLWASFWMVFSGHWLVVFFPNYRAVLMHLVFLGGYSLMTFAVATMVIFSHGGLSSKLKQSSWILTTLTIFMTVALMTRVLSVFYAAFYFKMLGISATFWLIAAGLWLSYVLPVAFRFVSAEEFERCHDEAKRRVVNLREGKPLR